MAAFMHRGFGRLSSGAGSGSVNNIPVSIGTASVTAGAVASGAGWVVVHAVGDAFTQSGDCPCAIRARIRNLDTGTATAINYATVGGPADDFGRSFATIGASAVFHVPADTNHVYSFEVDTDADGIDEPDEILATGRITAQYVPFDGVGAPPGS